MSRNFLNFESCMDNFDPENSFLVFKDEHSFDRVVEELSTGGVNRLLVIVRNGKKFLLKGLKPEYAGVPQYEAFLRKEYDIGMALTHPNIITVIDFINSPEFGNGVLMEWVDGTTLADFIAKNPDKNERIRIATELADALSYAHSKGVSHRDMKPDNILVTAKSHSVKLIDFGLGDTNSHLLMKVSGATEKFGAPEQLAGIASDEKSDIYTFGKIMEFLNLPYSFNSLRKSCLKENSAVRPPMDEIAMRLRRVSQRRRIFPAIAVTAVTTATLTSAAMMLAIPGRVIETPVNDRPYDLLNESCNRADSTIARFAVKMRQAGDDDEKGALLQQRSDAIDSIAVALEDSLRHDGLDVSRISEMLNSFWFHNVTEINKISDENKNGEIR